MFVSLYSSRRMDGRVTKTNFVTKANFEHFSHQQSIARKFQVKSAVLFHFLLALIILLAVLCVIKKRPNWVIKVVFKKSSFPIMCRARSIWQNTTISNFLLLKYNNKYAFAFGYLCRASRCTPIHKVVACKLVLSKKRSAGVSVVTIKLFWLTIYDMHTQTTTQLKLMHIYICIYFCILPTHFYIPQECLCKDTWGIIYYI